MSICTYVYMFAYVQVFMYICDGQRLTSGMFLCCYLPYFVSQGLTDLELTK